MKKTKKITFQEKEKEPKKEEKSLSVGQQVMWKNSKLKLFPSKHKSRWSGLYIITQLLPFGAVEIHHPTRGKMKVNESKLKSCIRNNFNNGSAEASLKPP